MYIKAFTLLLQDMSESDFHATRFKDEFIIRSIGLVKYQADNSKDQIII